MKVRGDVEGQIVDSEPECRCASIVPGVLLESARFSSSKREAASQISVEQEIRPATCSPR